MCVIVQEKCPINNHGFNIGLSLQICMYVKIYICNDIVLGCYMHARGKLRLPFITFNLSRNYHF